MKRQNVGKNYLYQFLYQVVILVIPLVLSPYLTRTLGDTALGTYSYVNSIAYYFVMLSMLGITKHGQRLIASNSNDKLSLRKNFWSLLVLHLIISAFFNIAYLLYVSFFVKKDTLIYAIEGFYVLSALFDITWLYYGLENFKSVTIKNAAVKIIECVLIFIFVKNSNDLPIYTLIVAGGLFIGQVIMWPQAISSITPIRVTRNEVIQHLKPILIFSVAVIAVSLYTVFDKTLLGILSTKENVAYYEYSNRIIAIPRTFIAVIGNVMFPKACKLTSENNIDELKKYMRYSLVLTYAIGFAAMFGLFAIADEFALTYYGTSFAKCGHIIISMAVLPLIVGVGDIARTQYMIPMKMDKLYTFCILICAVVNIILSSLLIPAIGVYGAVIGTVSAELFGCIYQLYICRRIISPKALIANGLPFLLIGFIMYLTVTCINLSAFSSITRLGVQVLMGALVYVSLSFVYFILFDKDIKGLILSKVTRRR